MSVTSFRFFKNYKHSKIDSNGLISISDKWETFVGDWVQSSDAGLMMDINEAVESIASDRDREIARLLFIEDKEFQVVADRFGLSVDYVYTVKNRLVRQLQTKLNSYR
jgi:DNA-directed RNA polymerase specialized sigma subunit